MGTDMSQNGCYLYMGIFFLNAERYWNHVLIYLIISMFLLPHKGGLPIAGKSCCGRTPTSTCHPMLSSQGSLPLVVVLKKEHIYMAVWKGWI